MIIFGSGQTVIPDRWTAFKIVASTKRLLLQYDDDGETYTIYGFDGQLAHTCNIWLGAVPDGVVLSGYSQAQNDADKIDFETNFKPFANRSLDVANRAVVVNYRKIGVSTTSYYLIVDLSNSSGAYKHIGSSSIKLLGVQGTAIKSKIIDQWGIDVGTVLSIDATQALIGWIRYGTIGLRGTSESQIETNVISYPVYTDLVVSGGDYTSIADSFKESVTDLNTTILIPDVSGTNLVASPGDLVIRANKISGDGTILFHHHFWYFVE
jgi:hypothetical protein